MINVWLEAYSLRLRQEERIQSPEKIAETPKPSALMKSSRAKLERKCDKICSDQGKLAHVI